MSLLYHSASCICPCISAVVFSPRHSDGPGDADCVFLSSTDSPGPGQSDWHIVGLSKQVFNVFTLFKPSGNSLQLKSIPIP